MCFCFFFLQNVFKFKIDMKHNIPLKSCNRKLQALNSLSFKMIFDSQSLVAYTAAELTGVFTVPVEKVVFFCVKGGAHLYDVLETLNQFLK